MISAIAARKAARAAAESLSQTVLLPSVPTSNGSPSKAVPTSPSSTSEGEAVLEESSRSPRKRKRGNQSVQTPRKRRRASPTGGLINFTEDGVADPTPSAITFSKDSLRGFSPSRPLEGDESEDDVPSDVDMVEEQNGSRPIVPPKLSTVGTYKQVSGANFISLSEDDRASLNLDSSPAALLAFHPRETLSFGGTARIQVLQGSIELFGSILHPSGTSHLVFAPRSYALPVIAALLPPSHVASTLPEKLRSQVEDYEIVIVIQELNTGVEGLGRVCPTFASVFDGPDDEDWGIRGFHPILRDAWNIYPFTMPASWDLAISYFAPSHSDDAALSTMPRIALVRGMKNSGKSTFAKTLVNNLVTKYQSVAFLECDIGQPEFTAPGLVSLHVLSQPVFGPAFSHPTQPFKSHFIGSSTPRSDPSGYLAAIEALMQTYKLDLQYMPPANSIDDGRISDSVPLVINTMGWTKGLGATLSQRIEELTGPSHIFEFVDQWDGSRFRPPNGLSDRYGISGSYTSFTPERLSLTPLAPPPSQSQYNASALRALSVLSYFHSVADPRMPSVPLWSTAVPLCAMVPWAVDWRTAFRGVFLTGAGFEDVVSDEIETVLNGAVVALVCADSSSWDSNMEDADTALQYRQGSSLPSPFSSHCVGLGVVHSINRSSSTLYVLTSLSPELLATCNALVKGDVELPVWGFLDHRNSDDDGVANGADGRRDSLPFLVFGRTDAVGGDRRRSRRNLMRRNQA